jgi:hypothetical protein
MKKIMSFVFATAFVAFLFLSPVSTFASVNIDKAQVSVSDISSDYENALSATPDNEKGKKGEKACCDKSKSDCKSKADSDKKCCASKDKAGCSSASKSASASSGCASASKSAEGASGDCSKKPAGVSTNPSK